MASPNVIKDIIKEMNDKAKFIDNFDKALIGYGRQHGQDYVAIYDASICLLILMEKNDIGIEEAFEIFNKCLNNGWPEKFDPIFVNDFRKAKDPNILLSKVNMEDNIEKVNKMREERKKNE